MHTLKVHHKGATDEFLALTELQEGVKVDVKYNEKSDSFIKIVLEYDRIDSTSGEQVILMEPLDSLIVTFRIRKQLSNFEEYPNDAARGFNIAHMPVFYKFQEKNVAPASMVYSSALLVSTPEPDFSMPFNVNAVTHMLFGVLFVNTIFILFTDPEEEVKESIVEKIKARICGKK